ncbi:Ms4527A family Cys-rich leader peptide [Mycolicibacterium novocastrense]|uniref:Ms4527A family Cys-rich leader peptide n=2 Tax=Mycolicibacterium novocastrense TaxID=59813 RepID=UPI0038B39885
MRRYRALRFGPCQRLSACREIALRQACTRTSDARMQSRRCSAHDERKSPPVRAGAAIRGTIGDVTAARTFPKRVSLVARRHVDFKRVCTCCCLPCA